MDIEIAIPTYNRVSILQKKTLPLLEAIPKEFIKIYVEDEEQYFIYKKELDNDYQIVITNTKGIGEKRNWIKNHTKAKYLLQIDDDIESIKEWNGISLSPDNIYNLIKEGFKECEKHGLHLWGICCFFNPFFLRNNTSTNLKFICGGFHGIITDKIIYSTINTFEDYYNTCAYFESDGGVLRKNGYGLKTKTFKEKGGLQDLLPNNERTKEEENNAIILKNRFGKMISVIKKKDRTDLRLNHKYIKKLINLENL
jgi:glycosyltransferase involved in cell wall biosynthesis